jgi:hypothetical protein
MGATRQPLLRLGPDGVHRSHPEVLAKPQTGTDELLPLQHESRGQSGHLLMDPPLHNVRLHSTLGYVPPIEWELNYRLQELQAA